MNTTHSPAPWKSRAASRPFCTEIVDATGCTIAVLDASDEAMGGMEDDTTLHADTRLIAAAPDLLAACQHYLKQYDSVHLGKDNGQTPHLIRAAIAKATGGAE